MVACVTSAWATQLPTSTTRTDYGTAAWIIMHHRNGLYICDIGLPPDHIAMASTVTANSARFTKREVKRATQARDLQQALVNHWILSSFELLSWWHRGHRRPLFVYRISHFVTHVGPLNLTMNKHLQKTINFIWCTKAEGTFGKLANTIYNMMNYMRRHVIDMFRLIPIWKY